MEELLSKAKLIAKGKTLEEAEIDSNWLMAYGTVARRCRDDRELRLTRWPYEQGDSVSPFTGGFFQHREWPPRKQLERHSSLRAVYEYEATYINAAGYWMAFHQAATCLRQEAIEDKNEDKALLFDVWSMIAVRYGLRVVGLRTEFYKMAARDPLHAKLVMPTLEQRGEVTAADDLDASLEKLESHMATQLMKAVATLSASNATKRAGKGATGEK